MLALDAFNATWLVGLVAFGTHLVLIGFMILRSGIAPRPLGVMVAVAGVAYIVDTTAYTVLSDYAASADLFTAIVAVPAVIAEGAFTLWLLLSAGKATGVAADQTSPGSASARRGPAGSALAARAVNP